MITIIILKAPDLCERERGKKNLNQKTLILKESSVRCTTNKNKHDNTTLRERETDKGEGGGGEKKKEKEEKKIIR